MLCKGERELIGAGLSGLLVEACYGLVGSLVHFCLASVFMSMYVYKHGNRKSILLHTDPLF